jgi:P27 family predicted phage terminase small subunit
VKLRQGETRPARINRQEPLPRLAAPVIPRGMNQAAQKVWRRVLREMRGSDVILAADADVLRCYCEAVARYVQAAELYARSSPLINGARWGDLVKNPLH